MPFQGNARRDPDKTVNTGSQAKGLWALGGFGCGELGNREQPYLRNERARTTNVLERRGGCESMLKPHQRWEGLHGRAKVRTGLGKSDGPGS